MVEAVRSLDLEPRTGPQRVSPPDEVVIDYHVTHGQKPQLHPDWAIFNTAAFQAEGSAVFISRAVHLPNVRIGTPDKNVLVVCRQGPDGKMERLPDLNLPVETRDGKFSNWEDPRAYVSKEGEITLGLTAVRNNSRSSKGHSVHPAIVNISVTSGELQVERVKVFSNEGKNTTPLNSGQIVYRDELNSHGFFVCIEQEESLEVEREVDFSPFKKEIPWMQEKMGMVAQPIPTESGLSLLPVHGVSQKDGKQVYALGFCVINKDWEIVGINPQPAIIRGDFNGMLSPQHDLNGGVEKEVVYSCGHLEIEGKVILVVNVGDKFTAFREFDIYTETQKVLKAT